MVIAKVSKYAAGTLILLLAYNTAAGWVNTQSAKLKKTLTEAELPSISQKAEELWRPVEDWGQAHPVGLTIAEMLLAASVGGLAVRKVGRKMGIQSPNKRLAQASVSGAHGVLQLGLAHRKLLGAMLVTVGGFFGYKWYPEDVSAAIQQAETVFGEVNTWVSDHVWALGSAAISLLSIYYAVKGKGTAPAAPPAPPEVTTPKAVTVRDQLANQVHEDLIVDKAIERAEKIRLKLDTKDGIFSDYLVKERDVEQLMEQREKVLAALYSLDDRIVVAQEKLAPATARVITPLAEMDELLTVIPHDKHGPYGKFKAYIAKLIRKGQAA